MGSLSLGADAPPRHVVMADGDRALPPMTRNEALVYAALHSADRPLKAYDLLEDLQDQGLRAPMTIYRALDRLKDKGLVHKVIHLNAFVCVPPVDATDVQAAVTCRNCGATRLVPVDQTALQGLLAEVGIEPDEVMFEVTGLCNRDDCHAAG